MTIRVVDFETTGINSETDRIIEIASIDLTRDGRFENQQSTLVNPGIPIPAQASAVHHILDEDVRDAPDLKHAIGELLLSGEPITYVAHNAAFEQAFMGDYRHFVPDAKWVCTYKCALRISPDLPSHSNQFLRYHLGIKNPFGVPRDKIVAHRAFGDVLVTGEIFFKIAKMAKFADMLAWSNEPPLHTILHFGKHKGARYDAVPRDYLEWITSKADGIDEGVKFSAAHWLNKAA